MHLFAHLAAYNPLCLFDTVYFCELCVDWRNFVIYMRAMHQAFNLYYNVITISIYVPPVLDRCHSEIQHSGCKVAAGYYRITRKTG